MQNPLNKTKNQVCYQKIREKILHNRKIYYTKNGKVINKKKDCDRNIFPDLSRYIQEQENIWKGVSQKKSDIFQKILILLQENVASRVWKNIIIKVGA